MISGAAYWGASLRFFRALLMSFKTNSAIQTAFHELDNGRTPVISVISTDEASLVRNRGKALANDDNDDEVAEDVSDDEQANRLKNGALHDTIFMTLNYAAQETFPNQAAFDAIERIRTIATALPLPKIAAIDKIKDTLARKLGNDRSNVVELTGRSNFVNRSFDIDVDSDDLADWLVVKRDSTLQASKDAFQCGTARGAILSGAASTGVSLHHANANAAPRTLVVLELPWSAQQFVQLCGRGHRSNQLSLPKVKMIVCDQVMAEKRFASTIQKRMADLGATTAADSRADGVVRFDSVNLCCFTADHAAEAVVDSEGLQLGKNVTASRLMNRCLAMPIDRGNRIMDLFVEKTAEMEDANRKNGTGPRTIREMEVDGKTVKIVDSITRRNGSKLLTIGTDYGIAFEDAVSMTSTEDEMFQFYRQKNIDLDINLSGLTMSHVVIAKKDRDVMQIVRPNGSRSSVLVAIFENAYERKSAEVVEKEWVYFYNYSESNCAHRHCARVGCNHGKRVKISYFMTFPLLDHLTSGNVKQIKLLRLLIEGKPTLAMLLKPYDGQRLISKEKTSPFFTMATTSTTTTTTASTSGVSSSGAQMEEDDD